MRRITKLLTLMVVAAALVACGGSEAAELAPVQANPAELPADVRDVAALADGPSAVPDAGAVVLADSLSANGEFISPSRSELTPKVPGRVGRVLVDEGARVTEGQALLALETDYLRLDVDRSQADLARAAAAFDEAERDFQRKQELRDKESIPQATFDRSRAAFEQTRAARAAAETGVAIARQRLEDSVLRSPLAGVVEQRHVDVGEHLAEGGIAFTVIQTAPLKLRFRVPEKYLGQIRPGQAVVASVDPYPGEKFVGTIKTVGGVIDPQTRTLFAEAEFPNRDGRLRPGLFARVEAKLQ